MLEESNVFIVTFQISQIIASHLHDNLEAIKNMPMTCISTLVGGASYNILNK